MISPDTTIIIYNYIFAQGKNPSLVKVKMIYVYLVNFKHVYLSQTYLNI